MSATQHARTDVVSTARSPRSTYVGSGLGTRLRLPVLIILAVLVATSAALLLPRGEPSPWDRIVIDTSDIAGTDPDRPSINTFIVIGMLLDELYARTPTSYLLAADIRDDKDAIRRILASHGLESVADETYWAIQGAHAFRVAPNDASEDFHRNIRAIYVGALHRTAIEYGRLSPDVGAVRLAIDRLFESQSEVVLEAIDAKR